VHVASDIYYFDVHGSFIGPINRDCHDCVIYNLPVNNCSICYSCQNSHIAVCCSVVNVVVIVRRWNFTSIHVKAKEFGGILPFTTIVLIASGLALPVSSCFLHV